MIEVKNLTRKYGDYIAVNNISFEIDDGKIYGFLGPNGAGKSTTMNMITGCLSSTSGQVLVNGHNIFDDSLEAKRCIGYLPEIPPLYPDMTPEEYLTFVARAKGIKKSDIGEKISSVMNKTGIADVKNKLIKNLSKGYKQRVGIAQAILGEPDIVILDEPTVGLDPIQIIEIRNLIKELGKQHTVILSSHILPEVSEVCDEIIIISNGEIVASDSSENLIKKFNKKSIIEVVVKSDAENVSNIIAQLNEVKEVEFDDTATDGTCKLYISAINDEDITELLAQTLMNNSILTLSINTKKASLEDVFLEVTSENIHMLTSSDDSKNNPEPDKYKTEEADE